MAIILNSPGYREYAKKQREKAVEEGLEAPEGQRLNKDAYNKALQESGYTDEQAVNYWKAHKNDPYYNIGKTVDDIVNSSAPKVVVSNGQVSISAPQSVLDSPYVSQLKKELQTLKGADLNSSVAQNAIKALNEQIKTNFSNSLITQATGWTPEEYADYQYALQTVTRPNPMSTSNKLKWAKDGEILKDENGNEIMKTPQEWVNYWRENYNMDERTDLFHKSLASTNPYERTMALVLSQGGENPIYGFDTWEKMQQGLGAAWNQLKQFPTGTYRLLFTDDKTAHLEELLDHTGLKAESLRDFSVSNENQFNAMKDAIVGKGWDDLTTEEKAFVMIAAVSQEGYRPKNEFLRAPETGKTDIEKMYRGNSESEGAIKRLLENASFDKYRETRNNFNTWQRYDEENSKDEERLAKNAAWSGSEQFWGNLSGVLGRYFWENAVVHGMTGGIGTGGKGGFSMNSTSEKIGNKLVGWLKTKGVSPASPMGQGLLQFGANLLGTIPEDLMQDAVDNIVTYNAKENKNLLNLPNMGESFKRNLIWLSIFNGAKAGLNAVKKARLVSQLKKMADLNQEMDIDGIASDADDVARAVKNGGEVVTEGDEVKVIDKDGNEKVLKNTTPEQAQMALFDVDDYVVKKGAESAEVPKVEVDVESTKTSSKTPVEQLNELSDDEVVDAVNKTGKQYQDNLRKSILKWRADKVKPVLQQLGFFNGKNGVNNLYIDASSYFKHNKIEGGMSEVPGALRGMVVGKGSASKQRVAAKTLEEIADAATQATGTKYTAESINKLLNDYAAASSGKISGAEIKAYFNENPDATAVAWQGSEKRGDNRAIVKRSGLDYLLRKAGVDTSASAPVKAEPVNVFAEAKKSNTTAADFFKLSDDEEGALKSWAESFGDSAKEREPRLRKSVAESKYYSLDPETRSALHDFVKKATGEDDVTYENIVKAAEIDPEGYAKVNKLLNDELSAKMNDAPTAELQERYEHYDVYNDVKKGTEAGSTLSLLDETPGSYSGKDANGNPINSRAEYYAKEKGEAVAVLEMTPDEYLREIHNGRGSENWTETDNPLIDNERVFMYKNMTDSGETKPSMVEIDYDKEGKAVGQEGRHRALASEMMGDEKIPVVIKYKTSNPPEILNKYNDVTGDFKKAIAESKGYTYDADGKLVKMEPEVEAPKTTAADEIVSEAEKVEVEQPKAEEAPKVEVEEEVKATTPEAEGEVNINKFRPTSLVEALKAKFQVTPDNVKKWHKATREMLNAQLQTHLNEFHDKFGDVRASDFDWVWYQGRQGKTPSQIIGTTDPTTGRVVTQNMIDAMKWWSEQPFVKDLRKASRESLGLEGDFDRLGYLPHTDYDPSNLSYEEAMTGALWENASGKSVVGDDGNYKGYGGDLASRYDTFASNMLWDARKTDVVAAKILEDAEMDGQEITPELIEESRKAAEGAKKINKAVADSPSTKEVVDTLSGKKDGADFNKINENIKKEGRNSGLGKAIHDNYQPVYRGANTMEVTHQRKGFVNSFDTLANRMRNTVIGNGMSMYDWGGADMVYAPKNAAFLVEDYMRNGGDFRGKLVEYVKNHSHRSDKYAEQVADKWMARIGAIEGPRTKGKVIEELYKAMRSEARTRLNKWLVMANYDGTLQADGTYKGGFNDSTKKMIDQFLFDHMQMDAVANNKKVIQRVGNALDAITSMRYRALFYGNIKNALLQVSELNRFFYTFKWGDVRDMARRMATDENFRARVETMTKAVAPNVSILDADLYQSYSAAADSMEVGEKGVTFKDLGKKTTDAADKLGLAPIEAAESFKNHMMVAGLVQEAERKGLTGDDALRYVRQRFERVALAADEMGKIGLASNPLAKPMLFLQNFQIRELGMHLYNIEDQWKLGKNIPQKVINEIKYVTKMFGAKLGTTLVLARLGYPASQALGLDPFGIMDNYNSTLEENEKTALDKQLTNGLLSPFLSGGMMSLFADFYFLGRKAYEDSVRKTTSDEAEQNLDQGFAGGWRFPNLTADQIFGGLATNFAPGATAFNRFNQMNQMMDSGWATSATGNKMYSAPDDPLNVILGYLFGRSATANAQQYNQTYGDNLLQTISRFNPLRGYQEFDPIDTKNYTDWFKGNEDDAQQFQKGIRYFREERNRTLKAFNDAINEVGATDDDVSEAKNTMNTRLNELFDQLDRFVDAYEKKNGTITPAMTKQVVNVLNIGQKNTSDTPEEAKERSQREYSKALGRYSDLGMSPVETWAGPDAYDPERETKLQGSPQYRSSTNRYWNLGSEAAQVLKAADAQLSGVRKDLKSSINAAYEAKDYDTLENIQQEYLKKFDQVVAPIIALYGNSILKRSDVTDQLKAMLSTGTSSRSADLIPSNQYRKDKYGRYRSMPYETVDVKKWAQQRYSGDLYKNPTTRTDSTSQEELEELKKLVQSGKPQRARAKALQIKVRVDNQEFAISKNDYQWLINFLKNGGQ